MSWSHLQYKRFDIFDLVIIMGVFLIGFLFALMLSSYYRKKKEKIEEINRKFHGLRGQYEQR